MTMESPSRSTVLTLKVLVLLIATTVLIVPEIALAEPADVRMLPVAGDPADAWPRWRGVSGQGVIEGEGYVETWSKTENVLWRTEVPGSGNSSPVIWGEHLFLTTSYDGGAKRSVLAYERKTGKQRWEAVIPGAPPEQAYPKNGHASSTPTTDGALVYAYLGNHGLVALNFDGEIVWHQKLGPMDAFHGTASSPLLLDDRLILVQDQKSKSGSFIAAFDKTSGEELWRTERVARVGWNSPVAVDVTEGDTVMTQIIMSGQEQVIAYAPEDGREVWSVKGNTFETIPTPVVAHGMIFCSSGRAGPTLAIKPGLNSAEIVWQSPKGSPFVPAPIVVGDYLYMVNDMASILTVYDAKSGEVIKQERMGESQREGFSAAPLMLQSAGGAKVFFTNDEGQTFVIQHAQGDGGEPTISHINELDERVIASPAAVGGIWYFRTAGAVLAIGSR